MKKPVFILLVLCLIIGISVFYFSHKNNGSTSEKLDLQPINSTSNQPSSADFLNSVVNYAHDSYLADQASISDSTDYTDLMTSLIEQMNYEEMSVSDISGFASSSNSTISTISSVLGLSQVDIISKQQNVLDVLRQVSNGTQPSDIDYSIAQLKASQDKRNSLFVSVYPLLTSLTMDTSSIEASSTATIGPLNPSNALTADEKGLLQNTLQADFGSDLSANKNDVYLLLAQEINLLLTSPTYIDFKNSWVNQISEIPND